MEIEQLRQDINELLEGVATHANLFKTKENISIEDVNSVSVKIYTVQEHLSVLKFLLETASQKEDLGKVVEPIVEEKLLVVEEVVKTEAVLVDVVEQKEPIAIIEEPIVKEATCEAQPKPKSIDSLPIAKLSESLTLNDRYLYANELFSKDMNAFNELVKSIDKCNSLDEAIVLFSSSDWELDNEHVIAFTSLVERRFF